ncbi:motility associated factor glycosyltransferase family protein [Pseudomonas japonica]|uniref:motility associated factor glycosyltransferase family protein n=1 Tax=Pseudomonas japonica TaxID=256466 RepID=UPI0015E2A254|nr:6-hydroxymethylpterin diphosphokinase MptE-like protein [Pseudomonas japonica]MBA1242128.1 motility associated factor glycosyltransferase family protein [Pseudomonas japonica]
MSEILTQNLAVIRERWPALAARLEAEVADHLAVEVVQGQEETLRVNDIQLTSRHGRFAEARLQAASLPGGCLAAHVYGPGLGDLPRVLLEAPHLRHLTIYLLNGPLFTLVLQVLDHTDWLADPRVSLAYAGDETEIHLPFVALPSELVLADDPASKIRDRLVSELHLSFNNRLFDAQDPEVVARLRANEAMLASDGDVVELFGTSPGASVYVVATGPSLEHHFDHLRDSRAAADRPLLICVDTAWRPLLDHGIVADIVVSIDQRISERHLLPEHSAGTCLVYMPLLAPEVLHQWRGHRLASYSPSPVYAALRQRMPKAELAGGGSVIHPAVDLAVRMGAAQVTLFGADFAFPNDKTHAGWSDGDLGPQLTHARHWVLDGHGGRVRTQLNFRSYLTELERYIARHPGVAFFNTSRDGAMIAGTAFAEGLVRE